MLRIEHTPPYVKEAYYQQVCPQPNPLFKKIRFYFVCVHVHISTYMHILCGHTSGCPWRPEEGTEFSGVELQAVVSCLTWALRTELRPSAGAASILNH